MSWRYNGHHESEVDINKKSMIYVESNHYYNHYKLVKGRYQTFYKLVSFVSMN